MYMNKFGKRPPQEYLPTYQTMLLKMLAIISSTTCYAKDSRWDVFQGVGDQLSISGTGLLIRQFNQIAQLIGMPATIAIVCAGGLFILIFTIKVLIGWFSPLRKKAVVVRPDEVTEEEITHKSEAEEKEKNEIFENLEAYVKKHTPPAP